MSQYGARGRALAGQTAATILAHYYRGTTLGSISSNTPIRVRVLSGWTATPTAPLLVYGRLAAWTVDGIAGSFPADAALRLIPATTSTATGPRTTWRLRITARERRRAARCAEAGQRRRSQRGGRRPAPAVVQAELVRPLPGRPADHRLGDDPDRQRRRRAAPRDVPARRRPGRDAVDLADAGAQGPGDRRPARMPHAGCARASRTTTSPTTRARRSTTGRSARRRRRTRSSARRRASSCAAPAAPSPTRCSIRPAAARPRTTRTSTCHRPARRWRAR